jgi:HSP20 family protein
MVLMRFDPFRDVDRLAQQAWGSIARSPSMPMDAYRHGDELVVHVDLPGVDPATIDLTVERNVLTVSARRAPTFAEGDQVLANERLQGEFSRQLFLGDNLNPDKIAADYRDGVLVVTIPVAERAKPRRVEVGSGARQDHVVAGSAD